MRAAERAAAFWEKCWKFFRAALRAWRQMDFVSLIVYVLIGESRELIVGTSQLYSKPQ